MKVTNRIFKEIKPYLPFLFGLLTIALINNGLNLWMPKITAGAIDSFTGENFKLTEVVTKMVLISVIIFVFAVGQSFL
ncbi:MAG: hypothetical protein EOM23_03355, partial [Candidatus Moranbacteria bacterium]|nr:hypothetical protein [Candidatus Moranbacteria bacterium]